MRVRKALGVEPAPVVRDEDERRVRRQVGARDREAPEGRTSEGELQDEGGRVRAPRRAGREKKNGGRDTRGRPDEGPPQRVRPPFPFAALLAGFFVAFFAAFSFRAACAAARRAIGIRNGEQET